MCNSIGGLDMIDDKQIEEAAYRFATSQEHGELLALIDGYKEGYKDAINEFLKNLWHPAIEKPKRRCNYLLLNYKDKEEECFEADVVDTKAWDCYIKDSLVEYINIDDLFPRKEVKNNDSRRIRKA